MTSESNDAIDVWVGGDGGTWSCSPSILYRIPTEIFDYEMMMGTLTTQEDLDLLMEKLNKNPKVYADDEYTDVHVQYGGNWSGLPSVLYRIPIHIFQHLQKKGNTEKTIGRLKNNDDLEKLIEKMLLEISTGIEEEEELVLVRSRPPNVEEKLCGHFCTASSVKEGCCECMDKRPICEDGYLSYIDGEGWGNVASRGAGYCPYCQY
jgi:hypothetical protein